MMRKELEGILNSIGLKTLYLPQFAMFGKYIKKDSHSIEFQVELDKDMKFKTININAFISENSYINETDINKVYDNFISDIEMIKKTHIELIRSLKSNEIMED